MEREGQDTQGMAMGQKTVLDVEPEREKETKKLDLSAAQVAGSSLATVAAALLASQMGVYGTILGAGVVSVVATAGGPVIQHFFRRTGDQLRETARPKARQVPVEGPREEPHEVRAPDGTMMLRQVPPPEVSEEFGAATVHGKRFRGWKRTAVASGAAFAIALGGIGTYEAIADTSVSKGAGPSSPAAPRRSPRRSRPRPAGKGRQGREDPGHRELPEPFALERRPEPEARPGPLGVPDSPAHPDSDPDSHADTEAGPDSHADPDPDSQPGHRQAHAEPRDRPGVTGPLRARARSPRRNPPGSISRAQSPKTRRR